jgi:hypothetical protein
MSITITLTEKEILETPNDSSLGELIRERYWSKRNSPSSTDNSWTCSICGKSTHEVESDYLIGYDHLECKMKLEMNTEYDNCVICGKVSPYTRNTHIYNRIGYVEGGGQGCFQPNICDKV